MTGKTHLSCGIFIGSSLSIYYGEDVFTSFTIISLCGVSSLVPDICHFKSNLGKKLFPISFIIRLIFGHRTFTHSLLFLFLIYWGLNSISAPEPYLVSILLGMLSHIVLDMLTPRGVKLFYPLDVSVKLPIVFKTGGAVDLSLSSAFSIVTIILWWKDIYRLFI
ncbi:metal-dependent hydrolase [Mammaliicoccus vitulinus]|uniref:metal-dependent hydrolase n=1 Tax=Mammaliicoccus vitulinus TaxID=71237 RepID=UPI003B9F6771